MEDLQSQFISAKGAWAPGLRFLNEIILKEKQSHQAMMIQGSPPLDPTLHLHMLIMATASNSLVSIPTTQSFYLKYITNIQK